MALADITALQPVLKQKYTQRRFNLLCYKNNPLYGLMPKMTDFGGKNKVVALRFGTPQGRGTSIAAAQAGKTASAYGAFVITRSSDYATASISGEAIKSSKGDENTLIEGLTKEIDGTIFTCMRSLAIAMYRNGGGARGVISSGSTVSSTTITLATLTDITNFEKGMQVQFASDDGSSSSPAGLRNSGASATITGVDRDLGTLTFGVALSTSVPAVATGDYIFQGVSSTANSDYGNLIKGLAGWIPATAPGSTDNWFGLNRSSDATRLGGIRYSGGGGPFEETLIEAAARVVREGGNPSHVFMNPLDYSNLVKALGAKVIYDRVQSVDEPEFGFQAVMLTGPNGPIPVLPDLNCPKGTAYMLQMDTWNLESLGEAPQILDFDGNTILRGASSDDYEVRVGYYAQMSCEAPGWNAVITL